MPTRMNDFDRLPDGKGEAYGKERRVALPAAEVTIWLACRGLPRSSSPASIAPPQRSPPPIQAVLGEPFPVAKPPDPQSTRPESPNYPPPITLLCRIA